MVVGLQRGRSLLIEFDFRIGSPGVFVFSILMSLLQNRADSGF